MDSKFLKPYNPQDTERSVYEKWEESGFFNPDNCIKEGISSKDSESFSIVLPPPNVTGTLHIGHALMLVIQDILIRYNRMKGLKTLWLPGTDHAAIATQTVVEKKLAKEKINKKDLGREEFLKKVDKFAKESHDTIANQIRKMGSSVDWSREAFTLDEQREKAVRTAFKRMYEDKLIYRGDRIVNWDPKGQTTISDDEIEYEDETTNFYYFQYGPFVIGTARPETKFGDKYVVMHPDDSRYKEYEDGQKIKLEWINGEIEATVIKDDSIDMEFGSGVMTITPWHSQADFEIAEKHNLDKEQIIDRYGKLLPIAGEFEGMKISEVREKIVEKLEKKGLLVKVDEKYTHRIAKSYRSGGVIEPQIMKQWFVDVNKNIRLEKSKIDGIKDGEETTLKNLMKQTVESGQIEILPDRFKKIYFNWIEGLHDWCISRQIWYGHRIPVWYKNDEIHVGEEPKEKGWTQDPDTLDTWFSSGLWTFSTLGWPEETEDLKTYHPTDVLETAHDIIFFWVARMILMSTYLLGEIPFKTVYLHGMVLDKHGKKMSKSRPETAIDPVESLEKYGTDALRMAMIVGVGPGQTLTLSDEKIVAYKKFANKIWNATRFVLEQAEKFDLETRLTNEDQKILDDWQVTLKDMTDDIENYRLYLAGEKIYHYFWHTFADKIIEESKNILEKGEEKEKKSKQKLLYILLTEQLKTLHPFMPFLTEEIWASLPHRKQDILMVEKWPLL